MIKNCVNAIGMLTVTALAAGCSGVRADVPEPYQGVVEHDERRLGFVVGGRVESISISEGSSVDPDEVLAILDASVERAARRAREAEVRAAEAQVELVRAGARGEEVRAAAAELRAATESERLLRIQVERQAGLERAGASPATRTDELRGELARAVAARQALDQRVRALRSGARDEEVAAAEAQAEAARVSLDALDERLAHHSLRAPSAGVVVDVHADPGEVVAPGAPVVTLADRAHPFVEVFVPQDELEGIRVGARVQVRVDALASPLSGEIEHVGSRTEFTPRYLFSERERPNLVVRVRVRVDDPAGRLHAGVPAFVTVAR